MAHPVWVRSEMQGAQIPMSNPIIIFHISSTCNTALETPHTELESHPNNLKCYTRIETVAASMYNKVCHYEHSALETPHTELESHPNILKWYTRIETVAASMYNKVCHSEHTIHDKNILILPCVWESSIYSTNISEMSQNMRLMKKELRL